jgi:hypothetical protein
MKYPTVIIYLGKDIPGNEAYALKSSKWCDVNMRRWIYAADIFMFGEYLTPKILFKPPFKIVQAETTCLDCGAITPIVAVEASGYVPTGGEGCDLALNIAYWLEGGADELKEKPVYLTFVQEYPTEFLKLIRRHSFLFRKYSFGEENDYFANACEHCKSPVDDFQLFYEQDGILARCNPDPERHETTMAFHQPLVVECQFA